MPEKHVLVIVGPTAVGKTQLTVQLAKELGVSVLNADSRQVFKELKIGTAKPAPIEMSGVKHYFVNDRNITQEFSAGHFEKEGLEVLAEIFKNRDVAIVSGGSGLYVDALCYGFSDIPKVKNELRENLKERVKKEGLEVLFEQLKILDPNYANEIDPDNQQRIVRALEVCIGTGKPFSAFRTGSAQKRDFKIHFIGLELPRELLYERINSRMDMMVENGLFEEAQRMLPYRQHNALQTVGYTEIFGYLDGHYDKQEAIRLLKRNSRRYAKRQLTWFKKNESVHWFEPTQIDQILKLVKSWID